MFITYPIIDPNQLPITPDRFDIAIIMEYKEPSTPSLHPFATNTMSGINKSVPKKDSATPSNNTIQK